MEEDGWDDERMLLKTCRMLAYSLGENEFCASCKFCYCWKIGPYLGLSLVGVISDIPSISMVKIYSTSS